jgi:hypothetical protein
LRVGRWNRRCKRDGNMWVRDSSLQPKRFMNLGPARTGTYLLTLTLLSLAVSVSQAQQGCRFLLDNCEGTTTTNAPPQSAPQPLPPVHSNIPPTRSLPTRPQHSSQLACCLRYYHGERSLEGWGPAERCRRNMASIKMDWCAAVQREVRQRRTGEGCEHVIPQYRQLMASGQMDYNSDAARYMRRQCNIQ